jgi:hypothetical protein
MSITRLLQDSSYDPSEVEALTRAFEQVCCELKLERKGDPLRVVVARKIFEIAERGMRDPNWIRIFVLAGMQGIYRHSRGGKVAA